MPYASRQNLIDRFGADEIDDLDPPSDAVDRVANALADADAEIDGKLAIGYDLPLPAGTYPLLVSIACDIARYRLYDDSPLEEPKQRAMKARSKLQGIANGKSLLVDDAGAFVSRRSSIAVAGPEPVMDRDSLAGF